MSSRKMKRSGKKRSLPPQLRRMSTIVRQLSRQGVKKDLFKKAAKIYHSKKRSIPRSKAQMMYKLSMPKAQMMY